MKLFRLGLLCIIALSLSLCSCGKQEGTPQAKTPSDAHWMSDEGYIICPTCGGTGVCQACSGTGRTVADEGCPACGGSGRCPMCNGEGYY